MALDGESPQLEKVGGTPAGRLPAVLISVAAVFVAIALAKPWLAPIDTRDTTNHPKLIIQPTPTAQPIAAVDGAGFFQQCYPTARWRLSAIQGDGSTAIRTVWPAAPSFAAVVPTGPGSIRIHGADVKGIGFCAPGDEPVARLARAESVSLWRRDASGAIVPVDGARVIDQTLANEGEVYLAPPAPLAANGAWPAGDYFFEIGQARPGSSATWLALQVVLAAPAASHAPTGSPSTPAAGS